MLKLIYKFAIRKDYYKIMGLNKQANSTDIKKKYHQLAKKYHPDVNKNSQRLFIEINEAYSTLSDPQKKSTYDQENFKVDQKGKVYQKYTSKSNFDYGRKYSKSTQSSSSQQNDYNPYRGSVKQQNQFYNQYIKNKKNNQFQQQQNQRKKSEFQRNSNLLSAKNRFKKILISFVVIMSTFELFLYFEKLRLNQNKYKIIDPEKKTIYYMDKQNYDRFQRELKIKQVLQQHKLELQQNKD